MTSFFHRWSRIEAYRWASGFLLMAMILVPVAMLRLGAPEWLAVLAALPIYLALTVLTFFRLQDARLSGWWVILMIVVLNLGPGWDGLEPLTFYASHLLHLVPIGLGWLGRAHRPGAAIGW